jgi:NAD(P)-dependent dehydrogenase (short-subunit alcohol dehydrogenase family)
VRRFGGLDGLVNNAGIVAVTRAGCRDIGVDEWDRVLAVNAKGTWLMTRAAIPALSRGGAIVNLASETAYTGSHGMSHYVASKAAVIGLTRALARELGPAGVRVNAIAPGYTDTEGGRAIGDPDTYDVGPTPVGRVARPEDMVGTLLHLLGPGSAFVTGQVLLVNGGRVPG